ncbi:GGDEF domain-containing protein [Deinococcus aquaedulcis]|uniref:GGDEF domain-containing protein n=1 Tax=Deinococcus aquaedulcis TaxID=2840455 RepID=UPI001C82C203|nr:GGDEF domain-containing protein [Deinococcus aquaedulcis]
MSPLEPESPAEDVAGTPAALARLLAEADEQKYADARQALHLATQAYTLAQALQDEEGLAMAHIVLGGCAYYQSDYAAALTHYTQAYALAHDRFPAAAYRAATALSVVHKQRGDYAQAMHCALTSLHLVHELGDLPGEARVLTNMGNIHWDIQAYDRALELHTQALERLEGVRLDPPSPVHCTQEAITRLNLVVTRFHLGEHAQALSDSHGLLAQCQALHLDHPEAILRTYRALMFLEQGQVEEAEADSRQALEMHRASGDREHEAMTLIARGRLHLIRGEQPAALAPLQAALALAQRVALLRQVCDAHRWLAAALEQQHAFEAALQQYKAFHATWAQLHTLNLDHKTNILAVEANVVALRREAQWERERRAELEQANADLRRAEAAVRHLADHDPLTGLPNRNLFLERLTQTLKLARRTPARHGVLFIDLDDFKQVNDTWGHAAGDEVLRQVAARLLGVVREADTVARFAGDEFVVLAQCITGEDDLHRVGQRIIEVLQVPFSLGGSAVHIGASVGYAAYPDQAQDLDGLLHGADTAMYQAKRAGKNRICAYQAPSKGADGR